MLCIKGGKKEVFIVIYEMLKIQNCMNASSRFTRQILACLFDCSLCLHTNPTSTYLS
jgi:hypothetical protein